MNDVTKASIISTVAGAVVGGTLAFFAVRPGAIGSEGVQRRLNAIGCLPRSAGDEDFDDAGELDLRRKAQIIRGGPNDHAGQVRLIYLRCAEASCAIEALQCFK
jgi:hypothetical protein